MTALIRLIILVPLAYIAAIIAAGLVAAYGLFGPGVDGELIGFFAGTVAAITLSAGAISFVPALIAVVLAEAFAWRSVFYYLLVGGALGLAADRLTDFIGPPALAERRLLVYLAAGFVAGLVYWLIAGRAAGMPGGPASRPPSA